MISGRLALISLLFVTTTIATQEKGVLQLHASSRQIAPDLFSCNKGDSVQRTLCTILLNKVNTELTKAGISITKNDVLLKYNNGKHENIPTGHSCTRTAQLRNRAVTVTLSRAAKLNTKVSSLRARIAVALRLPVLLDVRLVVRQRFGYRFLGKCKRKARDTITLKGRINTVADILLAFALQPRVRTLRSGELEVSIRPEAAVVFDLDNTDVRLRVSGASPFAAVYTFVAGVTSNLFRSIEDIVSGSSLKRVWEDLIARIGNDLGSAIIVGVGSLPRPVEDLIFRLIGKYGSRKLEKKAMSIDDDLENRLNERLRRALKTDTYGTRKFIIKKEYRALIEASGLAADIFNVPPPPSRAAQCASECASVSSSHRSMCLAYCKGANMRRVVPRSPSPSPSPSRRPRPHRPCCRGRGGGSRNTHKSL